MPNGIRIRSDVFSQCTGQTDSLDKPTDRSFTGKFDAAALRERRGLIITLPQNDSGSDCVLNSLRHSNPADTTKKHCSTQQSEQTSTLYTHRRKLVPNIGGLYPSPSPPTSLPHFPFSLPFLLTNSTVPWLVAWHSGRTSVFGRRTFPVLRSTCSWRVTTYVGKPSAIGQPTRPTMPFILSRSIN